jgi:hypothetical protein
MAHRLSRWLIAVVLACAAVAVILLPPHAPTDENERMRLPPSWVYGRAQRQLGQAVEILRLARLDQSLTSRVGLEDTGGGLPAIIVDPNVPSRIADLLDHIVAASWQRIVPVDSSIAFAVAVSVDTIQVVEGYEREAWWGTRVSHLLPVEPDDRDCVSVASFGRKDARSFASGRSLDGWEMQWLRESIVGACGYYAVFGKPGDGIARWLESWEYSPILSTSWLAGEQPGASRDWRFRNFRGLHTEFVGCAAGDLARCRAAMHSTPGEGRVFVRRADFTLPGMVGADPYRSRYPPRDALGPAADRYFADMVVEFGRDRFRAFWTSEAAIEDAFAQAMGVALDEWTRQWARTYIGVPQTARSIPLGSTLLSLVIAGVFVGGAGVLALRRQVS